MTQPVIQQKPEWKEVHHIQVELVVCTIKQSTHAKPRYSFDVSFFGTRGEPLRWHNLQWTGQGNDLKVVDVSDQVAKAVNQATMWIRDRMVQDYWDIRAEQDSRRAQWEKGRPKNIGTHQKGPKKEENHG